MEKKKQIQDLTVVYVFADDLVSVSPKVDDSVIESEDKNTTSFIEEVPNEIVCEEAESYLDDSSSSSSSSSSLSSWGSNTKVFLPKIKPLPIDVQFSIPAFAIAILYCFAHCAFFEIINISMDFLTVLVEEKTGFSPSTDRVQHVILLILAFLLLRISGDIWFWTSIIDSDEFYEKYQKSKRYRLTLARNLHSDSFLSESSNDQLPMMEILRRKIIRNDIRMLRWFKKHEYMCCLVSLMGFYLTYIPVTYFYQETCLWYAAEPRHEVLKNLPSTKKVKELGGTINYSPIFRAIASTTGPSPLLSQEEFQQWNKSLGDTPLQRMPDMVVRIAKENEDDEENEESCISNFADAFNVDDEKYSIDTIITLMDEMYYEDEQYLQKTLSKFSYGNFFGDGPAYFVSDKGLMISSLIIFVASVSLLLGLKVPFFDV